LILGREGLSCEALWISLDSAKPPARVERHAIQGMIRTLRDKVGLEKKITPHSFRHGFGYRGVRANANLRYLQVMMGHATLKTTTIYMGYKNQEVEDEYRRVMQGDKFEESGLTNSLTDVKYCHGNQNQNDNQYARRAGQKSRRIERVPREILFKERMHKVQ